jgi:zona occludens toxin
MSKSSVDEATSNDIEKWYKHWTIKLSIVFFVITAVILYSKLSGASVDSKPDIPVSKSEKSNVAVQIESDTSTTKESQIVKSVPETKSINQIQYEAMVSRSKNFHPFYKMELSISGSAQYTDNGFQVKVVYLSASQNGQHVFTMTQVDLLKAGYEVQILSDCAVGITYYEYTDYLTCNAPSQSISLGGQELASN